MGALTPECWDWGVRVVDEDAALSDVPKVRVNPPDLGSLDPFTSKSIPKIQTGMGAYFKSAYEKKQIT